MLNGLILSLVLVSPQTARDAILYERWNNLGMKDPLPFAEWKARWYPGNTMPSADSSTLSGAAPVISDFDLGCYRF